MSYSRHRERLKTFCWTLAQLLYHNTIGKISKI